MINTIEKIIIIIIIMIVNEIENIITIKLNYNVHIHTNCGILPDLL